MPFITNQAKSLSKSRMRDKKGRFITINPEFEKPLVQLSITNPFRKILYWLDQIRKRQTTTFAIKLSIPLIALPVIIFAIFQLGRLSGISFQKTQLLPPATPLPAQPITLSRAGILKVAKGVETRYLLALKNGQIINLQIPDKLDLTKYQNKQILVTGTYSKNTSLLTVTDIAEIELFNTLVIPQATPSPSPIQSATPSASQS